MVPVSRVDCDSGEERFEPFPASSHSIRTHKAVAILCSAVVERERPSSRSESVVLAIPAAFASSARPIRCACLSARIREPMLSIARLNRNGRTESR